MTRPSNRNESLQSHGELESELELVQALLEFEQIPYPWNPADPGAEAYLMQLEQEFSLDDWSEAEINQRAHAFMGQIDQLWAKQSLFQKFAARMPQHLLETIARQAQQAMAAQLSLADRLVQSVQDVLPQWNVDDLQVMARPLAYAMRGSEGNVVDSALDTIRDLEWGSLSEIEQVRLSLAAARYALDELEQANPEI